MIIRNVKVYTEDKSFKDGEIYIRDGRFAESPSREKDEPVMDGQGCYAVPGLIDMHFHGCMGADFCDGTQEVVDELARYELSVGVTSICPATMTLPVEELNHILKNGADYRRKQRQRLESGEAAPLRADLVGINMEGPFISKAKKGAQDERNILSCNDKVAEEFLGASEGLVKYLGVAPEDSENSMEFIHNMKDKVHISLAHTNADYDCAKAAFDAGADHAVHLYNAMSGFSHRAPGVVGAVVDSPQVVAELICDGIHIHPATVRATFKMLGEDRIVLISDSMRATGMKDGRYTLGGLDVDVKGKLATLVSDGAIAGSVTNLADCVRTAVKEMNIPLETAIACATINPAKCLGIDTETGSITAGKTADLLLLNGELELKAVFKRGRLLESGTY